MDARQVEFGAGCKGVPIEIFGCRMGITERKKIEETLKESETKYRAIFENTATATAIINEDMIIELANSEFERLSGWSKKEIEGKKSWMEFVRQEDRERMKDCFRMMREDLKAAPAQFESRFINRWGVVKDIHISLAMIPGTRSNVASLLDITEHKRLLEALEESGKHYRLLAENVTEVVWTMDRKLRYTYVSPSVERLRGYSVEEVMTQSIEETLTPASYEAAKRILTEVQVTQQEGGKHRFSSRTLELELRCKDGSTVWTETKLNFLRDPGDRPTGILGVTRDISERKRAEEALRESEEKLHFLSSRLLTAQETERKRISMELHDELGQSLIALKLGLSSIQKNLRKDQKILRDECEYMQGRIQQVIDSIRRLSQGLSPYLLETLGLTAALGRLIDDVTKYQNIGTSLEIENIDNLISQERQLIIYRIFQEALTNIRRYAEATHITVAIKKKNHHLSFLIKDNGKGFDMREAMSRDISERGLGLAAMEERVRMLGGLLRVRSEIGIGTRIIFTIPISKEGA